jgi:hypothetical protein
MNSYILSPNDKVLWVYGIAPLKLTASSVQIERNAVSSVTSEMFDFNAWVWHPAGETEYWVNDVLSTTTAKDFNFSSNTPGDYLIVAKKAGYISSDPLKISVKAAAPAGPTFAGGGCTVCGPKLMTAAVPLKFDTGKAVAFLKSQMATDGSFGDPMLNDWAAIALAGANASTETLSFYLLSHPVTSEVLTDIERRAMALMALGLNPYAADGLDYISEIEASYNNSQFGDVRLANDDIFGVIVLRKAGVPSDDAKIQNAIKFIIKNQSENGGWQSPDLTGAALQAFSLAPETPEIKQSKEKALKYLKETIFDDGGYANVFSASWVAQGLVAAGENPSTWKKNGKTLNEYLIASQEGDGGMKTDMGERNSRIWATSYAVPAALKLSWTEILHSFAKSEADDGVIPKAENPKTVETGELSNQIKNITALYLTDDGRRDTEEHKPTQEAAPVEPVVPFTWARRVSVSLSSTSAAAVGEAVPQFGFWSWLASTPKTFFGWLIGDLF